jgi:hypothetical protein
VDWDNLVQEWEIWRAPVNRIISRRVPYGVRKFFLPAEALLAYQRDFCFLE